MTITKRQFQLLSAMGIELWQQKTKVSNAEQQSAVCESSKAQYLTIEPLQQIAKQPLFKDILTCIELRTCDISQHSDHLDLGIVNWYFHEHQTINFNAGRLVTPSLATIAESASLKRSLWQTLKQIVT